LFSFLSLSFFGLGLRSPLFPRPEPTPETYNQLSRSCLLLCKNCSARNSTTFPNDKIRLEIANGRTAKQLQPALTACGVIKMLSPAEFENASSRNRAEPVAIWKARRYIELHSSEELSLTKVAKAVNINANYLSEEFKQVTGVNFVEYVAHTRFKIACALLRNPKIRISEIAFASGFQSLSQFNRIFKKFSGKSPTEYRAAKGIGRGHR
jgi:YesN/AraC family two-component response regulator